MEKTDFKILTELASSVAEKALGHAARPLTEGEAKTLAEIIARDGERLSYKTLKDLFRAVAAGDAAEVNPSANTLEILTRFAENLPPREPNESAATAWAARRGRFFLNEKAASKTAAEPAESNIFEAKNEEKKRRWRLLFWLFLFGLIGAGALVFWPKKAKGWTENFSKTDLPSLQKNGWNILDFCDSCWRKQLRPDSMLTLWTERGDYWFTEPDTARIPNVLFRPLEIDGAFSVTMKIDSFFPAKGYQQVGFFLLDESLHRIEPNVRFTIAHTGSESITVGYVKKENGSAFQEQPIHWPDQIPARVQPLWLRCEFRKGNAALLFKSTEKNAAFNLLVETKLSFEPKFVALAAMRGIRYDINIPWQIRPLNENPSIPAFVDQVKVELLTD